MARRSQGRGSMGRRDLLQALAIPAVTALAAGCHGGQGPEPVHPPVTGGDEKTLGAPAPVSPPVARVREFAITPGTAPAIVFRVSGRRKH